MGNGIFFERYYLLVMVIQENKFICYLLILHTDYNININKKN